MVDFAVLLKVLSVFIVAVISPGPDFVIVSATALAHGQKEGIKAAGGVATMVAGYTLISLLGIGALLQHYLWLALAIKICGGFYLIYLGFLLWRASLTRQIEAIAEVAVKSRNSFMLGFKTCLTNPKAIAFFASIFALALTAQTSFATKAAIFFAIPVTTFLWFSLVACGLSRQTIRRRYDKSRRWLDRLAGTVLGAFGLGLLWSIRD